MRARTLEFLLVAVTVLAGCSRGGGASGAATIAKSQTGLAIVSSSSAVAAGATFTIDVVSVTPTLSVYGGGFDLRYDPALVEFMGADTSASVLHSATDQIALRNKKPGAVVFARSKEGPAAGEDLAGLVARFTFRALAAGQARITMADLALIDGKGADLSLMTPAGVNVVVQ